MRLRPSATRLVTRCQTALARVRAALHAGIVALVMTGACACVGATTPELALLTILDGEATVLRGQDKLALREGVALQADDIVAVDPQSRLLRLEFADGLTLALGPGSRALLSPRLTGERARAQAYLLSGWAKLHAPQGVAAALLSPVLDVATRGGTVVLAIVPEGHQAFAEDGEWQVRQPGAAPQPLKAGELWRLPTDGAPPTVSARPSPGFAQAMPRAFMDSLPLRAKHFQGKTTAPEPIATITYADAQPWLVAEPTLRRAYLPRWRPLARNAEFRRGLVAGLKTHPEWQPVLFPPAPPRPAPAPPAPKPQPAY